MLITVNEVVKRIQSLLDDPSGSVFDTGYLLNFINQRYDDIVAELVQLDLSFEEQVAVITPFALATTDLSAYMGTGGLLESLLEPELIEWKLVGQDDDQYAEAERRNPLPDVKAATVPGISAWEWRAGNIYVTPSSVDLTLRVRFNAMSTNLVDPTDNVIRGVTNVLAYKVAELAAMIRGNKDLKTDLIRLGSQAMENFEVMIVKNEQHQVRRVGRFSNRGRNRFRPYVAR